MFTLEKIMNKYKYTEVNLTPVREKLSVLMAFKTSKDYYRKLEARGATLDERITALKRILTKFRNIDADLSGIEKKFKQLQEEKAGKGKGIEEVGEFRVEESTGPPRIGEEFEESTPKEEKVKELRQGKMSGSEIEEEEFEEFKP